MADHVAGPTAQRPVVHVGRWSVIESAGGAFVGILCGRNIGKVPAAIEGPMEGDGGRAGVDLAHQADGLVFQCSVNLFGDVQRRRCRVLIPPTGGA